MRGAAAISATMAAIRPLRGADIAGSVVGGYHGGVGAAKKSRQTRMAFDIQEALRLHVASSEHLQTLAAEVEALRRAGKIREGKRLTRCSSPCVLPFWSSNAPRQNKARRLRCLGAQ